MLHIALAEVSTAPCDAPAWIAQQTVLSQEGRILLALGQARGPLPRVAVSWLGRYHDYLARRLILPFEARCPEESGSLRPWTATVRVIELVPPAALAHVDDAGLLCRAQIDSKKVIDVPLIDLEVAADHANAQLIEDYWYWFWNWRFDPQI